MPHPSSTSSMVLAALALVASSVPVAPRLDPEAAWSYAQESRSEALLVMKDGNRIFEKYAEGIDPESPHPLASGSKSFAGAAAMVAVEDGLIKLDEPAANALTEWKSDPRKSKITFRQLLNMTDGLKPNAPWDDGWTGAIAMPALADPGTTYAYGSTHHNVFAAALERRLKNETFVAYLDRRIGKPLGMSIRWRLRGTDRKPQVAGGALCTARDWAKFGEWIRGGGPPLVKSGGLAEAFQGSKILPTYALGFWVKGATTPDADVVRAPFRSGALSGAEIPNDFRAAMGAGDQRLYIIPSLSLTIVKFGPIGGTRTFDDAAFFRALIPK